RQRDVALLRQALDELARHDFLDRARGALHFDAVIALQERGHFLARRVEQFRDPIDPNGCQTNLLGYSCDASAAASPRAAARIFSAVLAPTPGTPDSCSTMAAASASWVANPASTSFRTVLSLTPGSVYGTGLSGPAPSDSAGSAASPFSAPSALSPVSAPSALSAISAPSALSAISAPSALSPLSPPARPSSPHCASTSRRFSSSLLMSMRQPVSFAARRTFCPFLPMASDSCLSSTTTSITRSLSSTIETRCTLAGESALVTNA